MSVSLPLVRTVVLGTTNLFALIVLALSAFTLSQTVVYLGLFFTYSSLGVATAVIHLASVIAMIVVDHIRDDAFTSKVSFQVGWMSYLCIMWLATGAQTAATFGGIIRCGGDFCGATQAIAAFGFFNWIILLVYVITLIMAAVRAGQVGSNVWMTDVKRLQWVPGPVSYEKNNMNSSSNPIVGTYPPSGNPNYGVPPVAPQPQPNYQQSNYNQYGGRPPV